MGKTFYKYFQNLMGRKQNKKLRNLGASDEHVVSLIE